MRIASVEHAEHQNERHLVGQWQVGPERDLNVLLGVDPTVGQPFEGRFLHQLHIAAVEERFVLPVEMGTRIRNAKNHKEFKKQCNNCYKRLGLTADSKPKLNIIVQESC